MPPGALSEKNTLILKYEVTISCAFYLQYPCNFRIKLSKGHLHQQWDITLQGIPQGLSEYSDSEGFQVLERLSPWCLWQGEQLIRNTVKKVRQNMENPSLSSFLACWSLTNLPSGHEQNKNDCCERPFSVVLGVWASWLPPLSLREGKQWKQGKLWRYSSGLTSALVISLLQQVPTERANRR